MLMDRVERRWEKLIPSQRTILPQHHPQIEYIETTLHLNTPIASPACWRITDPTSPTRNKICRLCPIQVIIIDDSVIDPNGLRISNNVKGAVFLVRFNQLILDGLAGEVVGSYGWVDRGGVGEDRAFGCETWGCYLISSNAVAHVLLRRGKGECD